MSNIEEEQHCHEVPLEELIDDWEEKPDMKTEMLNLYVFLSHTHYEVKAYQDDKTKEYFWTSNIGFGK